jgi:two-component system nitrogen regulation response regulator GlnG
LGTENHQIAHKQKATTVDEVLEADIVFANGDGKNYLTLLKQVRESHPALPFVVVTRIPETSDWLDALEAGATDYCSAPFEPKHISWLMESAVSSARAVAA